jgi:hypothetical protein
MKRVIDNGNGTETTVAIEDGALVTGTGSYVAHAIADDAKARHNAGMFGDSDIKHAARIDPVLIESYLNRCNISFSEFCGSQDHMRRFLSDPSISHFRIWPGRI